MSPFGRHFLWAPLHLTIEIVTTENKRNSEANIKKNCFVWKLEIVACRKNPPVWAYSRIDPEETLQHRPNLEKMMFFGNVRFIAHIRFDSSLFACIVIQVIHAFTWSFSIAASSKPVWTLVTVFHTFRVSSKHPIRKMLNMPPFLPVPNHAPNITRSAVSAILPSNK